VNKIRTDIKALLTLIGVINQLDKLLLPLRIITSALQNTLPYAGIYVSAYVVGSLTDGKPIESFLPRALWIIGITGTLNALVYAVMRVDNAHLLGADVAFQTLMGEKTLSLDYPSLENPETVTLRQKISQENSWGQSLWGIIGSIAGIFGTVLSLIIGIIILLPLLASFVNVNIWLGLAFIVFIALIMFIQTRIAAWSQKKRDTINDENSKQLKYYMQLVGNAGISYKDGKDVRLFDAHGLISRYLFLGQANVIKNLTDKMAGVSSANNGANTLVEAILTGANYIVVGAISLMGALPIGSVIFCAGAVGRVVGALGNLSYQGTSLLRIARRWNIVMGFFDIPPVLPKGKEGLPISSSERYEIEFHDVSFKYPGSDQCALKNLSMKIDPRQRIAVVGRNGSGKTTMVKLLCRLYDPTEGIITINGIDIKTIDYNTYMSLFSVVFQDFKLFSFSLGVNVAADLTYDESCAAESLDEAGFTERIEKMDRGLETPLYKDFEEDGVEISGGEAQKIALARALYKDAPFIVLDEPTAALDPIAEFEVYSKFNEIVGGKTAIYISHRLSSCRFCDDIAVFHEGELIQRGSHDALIADENGKYHELWNAQAQYYAENKKISDL